MENDRRASAPTAAWVLLMLALFALWLPTSYSGAISLKSYRVSQGVLYSPWVGFANYGNLLKNPYIPTLLQNSALYALISYAGAMGIGILAAWRVPRIGSKRLRGLALGLLLLPLFVPDICWACGIFPRLNAAGEGVLWLYLAAATLPGAGLVGFAGAAFGIASPGGFWRGIGWVSLLSSFLWLTPRLELLQLLQPQSRVEVLDVLDSYTYRAAIMQANYSAGSALYIAKCVLQLGVGFAVCAVAWWLLRGREARWPSPRPKAGPTPFALWCIPAALLSAAMAYLFRPKFSAFDIGAAILRGVPRSALTMALAGLLGFGLAWGAITALRRAGWGLFCQIGGFVLALRPATVGAFMLAGSLNLGDTALPLILTSLSTPQGWLLTLLCAQLSKPAGERSVRWLAALPACYAAMHAWSGAMAQSTYLRRFTWLPTPLMLREQLTRGFPPDIGLYFIVLVPSLLLAAGAAVALARGLRGKA